MKDNSRTVAFRCLEAVGRDDAYANLVMPHLLRDARLSSRDAAFATELAYGTLRMRRLYDAVIEHAAGRAVASIEAPVLAVLELGVHQALAMDVPEHAAVSETVALAKSVGLARASGLTNAVMRRVVERSREEWLALVAQGEGKLGVRLSHPDWVVDELRRSLADSGREAELPQLLESHNRAAPVTLVARPCTISQRALADDAGGEPTSLSPFGVVMRGGSPGDLVAVKNGGAAVQDEGSQLVAAALASAAAKPAAPGERWLDACAGPGGKTALLGALASSMGASVDALELHDHRAALVKRNVRALPDGVVSVLTADATLHQGGPYDRILVDAPCTGLGALRRRPEARWRRTSEDLADLVEIQDRLLKHAATLLAPGGVLAYVTCSPVLRETRERVAASGLTMLDARAALAEVTGRSDLWGDHPDVQLWTHVHGTDSMYLALLSASARG